MDNLREKTLNVIREGEIRISFLRDCIDIQEKAMKKGLAREHVMPDYVKDIEELDELIEVNKALSRCLSDPEFGDKTPGHQTRPPNI